MEKEEMILLLKKHKETKARLELKKKEKNMYEKRLKGCIEIETSITGKIGINLDIRSKNSINDKVGNAVVDGIKANIDMKKEAEKKIKELEPIIEELQDEVDQVNIMLDALYYKEREILTAYYIDNRDAEEIGRVLYWKLYNRTCTAENIYRIIKKGTEILLRL